MENKNQLKNSKVLIATLAFAGILSTNTSFSESVVKTGEVIEAVTEYQLLDKDLVQVKFIAGSAELSKSSLDAISDFVKTTQAQTAVNHFIVASWADQDYPAKGKLSRTQRKLASLRADNIKKVLEASGSAKIKTFEMTKQPNWIQRAFNTESAELKRKGSSKTQNERLLKEIGQRLHDKGGPTSAVIVARFRNEISTQ